MLKLQNVCKTLEIRGDETNSRETFFLKFINIIYVSQLSKKTKSFALKL